MVEKSYFETIDDALAEKAHLSPYTLPHNEVYTHTHSHNILTDESTNLEQDLVSIATGALVVVLRQRSVLEEYAYFDCSRSLIV